MSALFINFVARSLFLVAALVFAAGTGMGQSLHYAITHVTAVNPSSERPSLLTMPVISASKTFFSMVNAVMLRPLPLPEPDRLVQIAEKNDKLNLPNFSSSVLNFRRADRVRFRRCARRMSTRY